MFGAIFDAFYLCYFVFYFFPPQLSFQLDIVFYLLFIYQTVSQLCALITALRLSCFHI